VRETKFGDLLTVKSGIIVHGCNSHGVMGSGVALSVRNKYPECFKLYYDFCKTNRNFPDECLGKVVVYQNENLFICNAITQRDFGKDGRKYVNYQAVQECFSQIAELAEYLNVDVHYPLIGCGLGGGDWAIVSDLISQPLEAKNIKHCLWILE
jgi:O-acetyl-ADP-ribose deacetylase (regulator of RNase III)